MRKLFLFFLVIFLISSNLILLAQETRRLYIKSMAVKTTNPDGKSWDAMGGAPDIKIIIFIRHGANWKKVFTSHVMKDRYAIAQTINTKVDVTLGSELKIEVLDEDISKDDLIGRYILTVTGFDFDKPSETEVEFGAVNSFTYFFSKYNTLDISAAQRSHVKNAEFNIYTAEKNLSSSHSASLAFSYIENAEKEIAILNKDIPDHPKVVELEYKLRKLSHGFEKAKVEDIVKKIDDASHLYESDMTKENLENISTLVSELKKYSNVSRGKEAYEKWSNWLAEKEKEYSELKTKNEMLEARARLTGILGLAETFTKPESISIEKLKQYVQEAEPHVVLLSNEKEKNKDILDRYEAIVQLIKDQEARATAKPDLQVHPEVPDLDDDGEKGVYLRGMVEELQKFLEDILHEYDSLLNEIRG